MTKTPSSRYLWRTKARLTVEQTEEIDQYLLRATLFWNFMIDRLAPHIDAFLKHPVLDAAAKDLEEKALTIYETARQECHTLATLLEMGDKWRPYFSTIFALPDSVLKMRLFDLLSAYKMAHSEQGSKIKVSGIPRRKDASSTQSVRFGSDEFSIVGDELRIHSAYPIMLKIDAFKHAPVAEGLTLSVTRKPVPLPSKRFGPVEDTGRDHCFTLR